MKALRVLAVSAAVLAASQAFAADESASAKVSSFFAPLATADFYKPFSVRAEVGTLGYGGAVAYDVDPVTTLVVGYNGGEISDLTGSTRWNGVKFKNNDDNNNAYLNLEVHPIPQARWVNVAFGVAYVDDTYRQTQANHDGFLHIDDKYFDATNANVSRTLSYKKEVAPFLGLGVTPQLTKNIGLFAQVGAYYTGHPDVQESTTTEVVNAKGQLLSTALRNDAHQVRHDDQYNFLPVAKLGLTLRY